MDCLVERFNQNGSKTVVLLQHRRPNIAKHIDRQLMMELLALTFNKSSLFRVCVCVCFFFIRFVDAVLFYCRCAFSLYSIGMSRFTKLQNWFGSERKRSVLLSNHSRHSAFDQLWCDNSAGQKNSAHTVERQHKSDDVFKLNAERRTNERARHHHSVAIRIIRRLAHESWFVHSTALHSSIQHTNHYIHQ